MDIDVSRIPTDYLLTASEFACPNTGCPADRWQVGRQPGAREVWLVTEAEDATLWRIAARVPICPLCGADLVGVPSC